MAFLEVIGIASILPFMQLAAEPEAIREHLFLSQLYDYFEVESTRQMLIAIGATVLGLLAVANGFTLYTQWLHHKFAWDVMHQLCMRLMRSYLKRSYRFFLGRNTSELFSNLITEVSQFSGGILVPLLDLLSQVLVAVVIFILLMIVDFRVALLVTVSLGSAYGLIYLARKGLLRRLGQDRIAANLGRFKSMNEALTGIKTLRVFRAQDFFYNRFEESSAQHAGIMPVIHMVIVSPRYLIEVLAFGGIIATTLYLLVSGQNLQEAIPMLSLYALAGYRLLPALQKSFAAAAKLRNNFPVVENLAQDMQAEAPPVNVAATGAEVPAFGKALELRKVSFFYEETAPPTLDRLSVTIRQGETVAFVGATGAGKTTLIDLIVGLLHPQKGEILVDGVPLQPDNVTSWQAQIGYVPQDVFLFDDTVARNIAIGLEDNEIDIERLQLAARVASIHTFITEELSEGYQTTIGERGVRLSGGQRQRLGLARAIYHQPRVLILDEATSALDSITEHAVIESLKSDAGVSTVIIIAHRLSTVRHANCIYLLDQGRIMAQGPYDILVNTSEVFREMAQLS